MLIIDDNIAFLVSKWEVQKYFERALEKRNKVELVAIFVWDIEKQIYFESQIIAQQK